VATTAGAARAVLSVANSGPAIPRDEVERLFRPFRRLGADRTEHSDGIGLGRSIVQAIATAHQATPPPMHNRSAGSRSRSASLPERAVAGGDLEFAAAEGGLT
jgi:K+-sensing histidine kinase KdpD